MGAVSGRAVRAAAVIGLLKRHGIRVSPGLRRTMLEPFKRRDRRDPHIEPPDEVAIAAVRRHDYLAPYLVDNDE